MSLKTLKADLSLAKMKHQTKPSEATKAILEKAQKAYDDAISEQENEGSTADVKTADTKADREPAIKSISQLVMDMSDEDFADFKEALSEALRSPENAARTHLVAHSPLACPFCGRSLISEDFIDESADDPTDEAGEVGEPAGEQLGDDTTETSAAAEPATTKPAAAVVSAPEQPATGAPAAKPASATKKPTGAAKGKADTEEKKTEPQS